MKTQNLNTLVTILLFFWSCGTKPSVLKNNNVVETTPKLIFLNYNLYKDDNDRKTMEFVSKKIVEGKQKSPSYLFTKSPNIGDLKCVQLNQDSIETLHFFIKNPFFKTIEYLNDSLIFDSKKIALKKTSLAFRMQLDNKTKYIAIKEVIDTLKNTKPLITTILNQ